MWSRGPSEEGRGTGKDGIIGGRGYFSGSAAVPSELVLLLLLVVVVVVVVVVVAVTAVEGRG